MAAYNGVTLCIFVIWCVLMPFNAAQEIMSCDTEADLVFLVDSSVSIRESNPLDNSYDNWHIIKQFIVNITMRLPTHDKIKVGVLKFSKNVDTYDIIRLGEYADRDDLKNKIMNMTFLGKGTNTSGAIWFVNHEEHGMFKSVNDRSAVQNYAVLITDGLANRDAANTRPFAQEARRFHGTKFFTVGITKYVNVDELQEIASDPVSYYSFLSKDFRNLNVLLDSMLTRLCRETPPPRAPCMDTRADVTFLLDSSGSIGNTSWTVLKEFVVEVISSLDLAYDRTRVAVIRYSTMAEVVFDLGQYFGPGAVGSLSDMRKVIMELDYLNDRTNISGAIKLMRRDIYNEDDGDRLDIQNIGILISDGEATEDTNETSIQADLAKAEGIRMFVMALTTNFKEDELTNIASKPTGDHFLNATRVSDAPTLTSRLIWGVCGVKCQDGEATDDPLCRRNSTMYGCQGNEKPTWRHVPEHILLGHNYDRLDNIMTAEECQKICYKDTQCRSIDYVPQFKQCAVSYVNKAEAEDSFVAEPTADYYELTCLKDEGSGSGNGGSGSGTTSKPTNAGSSSRCYGWMIGVIILCWVLLRS